MSEVALAPIWKLVISPESEVGLLEVLITFGLAAFTV